MCIRMCEITNHGFGLFWVDLCMQKGADWMYYKGEYRVLKPHKVHRRKCIVCNTYREDGPAPEFVDQRGYKSYYNMIQHGRQLK